MVKQMLAVDPDTKILFLTFPFPPYCKSADAKIRYLLEKIGDKNVPI